MIDINPSQEESRQPGKKPMNLGDFARANQITENRVWELIEEGELAARFVNDEILILREQEPPMESTEPLVDAQAVSMIDIPLAAEPPAFDQEILASRKPDWPAAEPDGADMEDLEDEPFQDETGDRRSSQSDDTREILMFAQDAMTRTMELSRQLLATKDELLRLKDEKLNQLEQQVKDQTLEIRRLKRQLEDMETLCKISPIP